MRLSCTATPRHRQRAVRAPADPLPAVPQLMFYNCSAFTGDLSRWDVSKVTSMEVRLRALRLDRPARPHTTPLAAPSARGRPHPRARPHTASPRRQRTFATAQVRAQCVAST